MAAKKQKGTVPVSIYLPPGLYVAIKELAEQDERSISAYIKIKLCEAILASER